MLLIRALFLQFFQRAVRTLNAHAVQHGLHVGLEAVQILLTQRRLLLDLALRQSDGSFFAGILFFYIRIKCANLRRAECGCRQVRSRSFRCFIYSAISGSYGFGVFSRCKIKNIYCFIDNGVDIKAEKV